MMSPLLLLAEEGKYILQTTLIRHITNTFELCDGVHTVEAIQTNGNNIFFIIVLCIHLLIATPTNASSTLRLYSRNQFPLQGL